MRHFSDEGAKGPHVSCRSIFGWNENLNHGTFHRSFSQKSFAVNVSIHGDDDVIMKSFPLGNKFLIGEQKEVTKRNVYVSINLDSKNVSCKFMEWKFFGSCGSKLAANFIPEIVRCPFGLIPLSDDGLSPSNLFNQLELLLKTGTPAKERAKWDFPRRKSAFFKCQSLEPERTCVLVWCAFTLRVCGSQSSAPPHNLEVDYDFNDFPSRFGRELLCLDLVVKICWKFSFRWRSERKLPSSVRCTGQ